jgi:hypothetical protein
MLGERDQQTIGCAEREEDILAAIKTTAELIIAE